MWRIVFISALALGLIAVACSDGTSPNPSTPTPSPLSTAPAAKATKQASCEPRLPTARLMKANDERQDGLRTTVDWFAPDLGCGINGHPIDSLAVPEEPLRVAQGERLLFVFDRAPSRASGRAWQPDFSQASEPTNGSVEISITEPQYATPIELVLQPAASQELVLDQLPPGDYALLLGGGWPEGTTSFAFRVLIDGVR